MAGAGGDVGDVAAGDVRNVAGTCHPCSDAGDETDFMQRTGLDATQRYGPHWSLPSASASSPASLQGWHVPATLRTDPYVLGQRSGYDDS